MRNIFRAIAFFPSASKGRVALLLGVTMLATLFEGFGVAMLYPVLDFVEKGQDPTVLVASSRMWRLIFDSFNWLGLPLTLGVLLGTVFVLFLLRQWFIYLKTLYSRWLAEGILADIRSEGFRCLLEADAGFYDRHHVGEMINVMMVDGQRAGNGVYVFFLFLSAVMIFLFYYALLAFLSPLMTLLSLVVMIGAGVIVRRLNRKSQVVGEDLSRHNDLISSAMLERLNGSLVVKLAASERREQRLIRELSDKIKQSTYHLARLKARIEFIVDPVVVLAGLVILYLSIEAAGMSLAAVGVFMFVLLRLTPYAKDIFSHRQSIAAFSGSITRVIETLETAQGAKVIVGGPVTDLTLDQEILLEGVSFSYDPVRSEVLSDLHISVPAGKMTALVGPSGAGKSTLASLLPRLREPTAGRITFDGEPIERFDLSVLRRSVAFVAQDGFLFDDTLAQNIRYCRPDATPDEVVWAAELAHAHDFIEDLSEGYQTRIGARGVMLSGGQRQRVILARALLQKARLIILDEPTSALDSESEERIKRALEGLRRDRKITLLVIAHRLSTIQDADQIVVMNQGRVSAVGTHQELLSRNKWYDDMIRKQSFA